MWRYTSHISRGTSPSSAISCDIQIIFLRDYFKCDWNHLNRIVAKDATTGNQQSPRSATSTTSTTSTTSVQWAQQLHPAPECPGTSERCSPTGHSRGGESVASGGCSGARSQTARSQTARSQTARSQTAWSQTAWSQTAGSVEMFPQASVAVAPQDIVA